MHKPSQIYSLCFTSPVHCQRVQLLHHLFTGINSYSHRSILTNPGASFVVHVKVKVDYELDMTSRFGVDGSRRCLLSVVFTFEPVG